MNGTTGSASEEQGGQDVTVREALQVLLTRGNFVSLTQDHKDVPEGCIVCGILSYLVSLVSETFPVESDEQRLQPIAPRFFNASLTKLPIASHNQSHPEGSEDTTICTFTSSARVGQRKRIEDLANDMTAIEPAILDTKLREAPEMVEDTLWVTIEATALQALIMMSRLHVEAATVVNEEYNPIAVITAHDIKALAPETSLNGLLKPVLEFVNHVQELSPDTGPRSLLSCTGDTKIRDMIQTLAKNVDAQHLLVVDNEGATRGMISLRALLKKLYETPSDCQTVTVEITEEEKDAAGLPEERKRKAEEEEERKEGEDKVGKEQVVTKRVAKKRKRETPPNAKKQTAAAALDTPDGGDDGKLGVGILSVVLEIPDKEDEQSTEKKEEIKRKAKRRRK